MKYRTLILPGALLFLVVLAASLARADSLTNPAGATVELLTTATDSGATLTNTAGATLEVLTTDQASADLRDGAGVWAFVGLLDSDWAGNAARYWTAYD